MTAMWNNTKTLLLMAGLTGLLVAVGGSMGQQFILPFLGISILMNLGAWYFSDTIAIRSMRGREVTRETGGELYAMVDELRQRAGLPMPRVYICPHQAPNAFATGRSPSKAAVAFTEGALHLLDRGEMAGVVAHELAHIKNRDTLTSTIAATISGVLASVAQFALFFGGSRENSNPLGAIVAIVLAPLAAMLIKAMISRSREYVADAEGAAIAGSPEGLISALQKLESFARRIPLQQPNPAMNNMFIVEPFVGKALTNLFATHPPTERRVAELAKLRGRV
jgi:heat shock protein HtpX